MTGETRGERRLAERLPGAAGTSVAAVQAERARQARLVSDGAAGARAAAERIARRWGGRGGRETRGQRARGRGGGRRAQATAGARRRRNDTLAHRGTAIGDDRKRRPRSPALALPGTGPEVQPRVCVPGPLLRPVWVRSFCRGGLGGSARAPNERARRTRTRSSRSRPTRPCRVRSSSRATARQSTHTRSTTRGALTSSPHQQWRACST